MRELLCLESCDEVKYFTKNRLVFLVPTLACGVACMLLRFVMMVYGFDEKGLLVSGHISMIISWVIAAAFLIGLFFGVKRIHGNGNFDQLFPASFFCGGLVVLAGVVIAVLSLGRHSMLELVLGIAAGVCMIVTGIYRFQGKHPHYGFHFVVCIFFIVKLITNYRSWSIDPQLQDYAFQMLASVMLMLAAFYRSSVDANMIDRKKLVFTCLAACFFCIASISDPENPIYYAACGLWAVGGVGILDTVSDTEV